MVLSSVALVATTDKTDELWMCDPGALNHMTHDRSGVWNFEAASRSEYALQAEGTSLEMAVYGALGLTIGQPGGVKLTVVIGSVRLVSACGNYSFHYYRPPRQQGGDEPCPEERQGLAEETTFVYKYQFVVKNDAYSTTARCSI